jgi:type II secretory pathway component PulC
MRAVPLALVVMACGSAVSNLPRTLDDEAEPRKTAPAPRAAPRDPPRTAAPAGKSVRNGTIARARLVAVLDAGPGTFLRQLEVAPRMSGDRFVGWQLVQLIGDTGPLTEVDVAPGDVLLAINGKPLERPDELQTVWDSLRTANELTAQLSRGDARVELRFTIDPPVGPLAAPTAR